jgi:hypothetical protein
MAQTQRIADFPPEQVAQAGLQAFFNITEGWGLSTEEQRTLLGAPAKSTFFKWKGERQGRLSRDTLERISYIMGIYKALHVLLPSARDADEWVKRANTAPLFGGRPALEKMLAGNVSDLADVRRYLDAERGG